MENDEKTPELEQDENKNQEEETNEETQEESSKHQEEVDWKAEALKQKAINKRLSEKINKPIVKSEYKEEKQGVIPISQKDIYAMSQANVHIDDYDDVVDYAKFKNITVQEALKTDVIKTTLATKSEFRKTAEATNTGATRRGTTKVSDDVLVKNLQEGKIPEKGSEEAERLFWARRGGKR